MASVLALINTLGNWLTVAVGLGFVIFLHELGHFLLAKWNDVKVEKFSIGFGPALFKFHRGETEYALSIIPLGGFVKMLGEGDETSGTVEKPTDPRAYSNKPVGARMAIISAGVIMNIILGVICFVAAYGMGGLRVAPARIDAVIAGAPAYNSGLRVGDEIVAINDKKPIDFIVMKRMTAYSGPGAILHLKVKRPGQEELVSVDVEPRREADADMKTMGIALPADTTVAKPPYIRPAGLDRDPESVKELKPDDHIVAIGPKDGKTEPAPDTFAFLTLLSKYRSEPIQVVVERKAKETGKTEQTTKQISINLPAVPFVDFGFRLGHQAINAIRPGSPAAKAGFQLGDRIIAVDGQLDFDPMKLPDYARERAGRPIEFRVQRGAGEGAQGSTITVTAIPDDSPTWVEEFLGTEPLEIPGLGLAFPITPRIEHVTAGSPAAKAGLKAGQVIEAVSLADEPEEGETPKKATLKLDGKDRAWPTAFGLIQRLPRQAIEFTIADVKKPVAVTPSVEPTWFNPKRGFVFYTLTYPLPPMGVAASIRRGFEDTRDTIHDIYAMLRNLFLGLIGIKALGGPLTIATIASQTARMGLAPFLHFIGLLSVNLAVINFLPIPPLDGGQMAFLIAEKVRGRPLPERALAAGTYAGIVFVLGLMGFVLIQDVIRLFGA